MCPSYVWIFLFVFPCIIIHAFQDEGTTIPGPVEKLEVAEFLASYSSYNKYTTSTKKWNMTTLVYTTPWNKRGYEITDIFASKFDIVSPTWFLIMGQKKSFTVTGIPDIEKEWIEKTRKSNPSIKIAPRFSFAEWTEQDFSVVLRDTTHSDKCITNIIKVLKNYKFDGAVIEIWTQLIGPGVPELVTFLKHLFTELRKENFLNILVIPPPVHHDQIEGRFTRHHFEQLYSFVDYFSLMTYDYSSPARSGPNSPITWMADCVRLLVPDGVDQMDSKRAQLLTGFNFYGMHYVPALYRGSPVLGHEFVDLIRSFRPKFQWHKQWAEHSISFSDSSGNQHIVFYPTLLSIARRIELALQLGTGISIWEVGQGLDSFYELL